MLLYESTMVIADSQKIHNFYFTELVGAFLGPKYDLLIS
jgi:hypothetical protein